MKKIDTVGFWWDRLNRIDRIVVNYRDGSVKNFPALKDVPEAEMEFAKSAENRDMIRFSNGTALLTCY